MTKQIKKVITPCPECRSKIGYIAVGPYRSQCRSCYALLKNSEIVVPTDGRS